MLSRLTAALGVGGPALPFELGEPLACSWGSWQHYRGTWRADGGPVSVFRLAAASKSDARLEAGRAAVKRLRATRHPGVLAFRDSAEAEERGEHALYLVTEAVTPLAEVLGGMGAADRAQYTCVGLSSLVAALSFLANDCGLVHGAVCLPAVFVTQTLDWKLGAFDLASEHAACGSPYDLPLAAAAWLLPPQYKAGEVAKGDWQVRAPGAVLREQSCRAAARPGWGVQAAAVHRAGTPLPLPLLQGRRAALARRAHGCWRALALPRPRALRPPPPCLPAPRPLLPRRR